ncbi:MAG: methyltransferase domain-containing protein [Planctomycetes bacterium]|nr:methyltransferase domain-containing protein [Planctomycetota bacterium]
MSIVSEVAEAVPALHAFLWDYYGRRIEGTGDLVEGACRTDETRGRYAAVLERVPSEARERHYGCGCPFPLDDLSGLTVLDLGSGAGVDAFIARHLVGPRGQIHGIDCTPEQLEVARRNAPVVARRSGYAAPNTRFHQLRDPARLAVQRGPHHDRRPPPSPPWTGAARVTGNRRPTSGTWTPPRPASPWTSTTSSRPTAPPPCAGTPPGCSRRRAWAAISG